jgi:hypothetical protein
MTTTLQPTAATATTIRIIHAAMGAGVLVFALVGHFVLRPALAPSGALPPLLPPLLLASALGACALSFLLRRRVPRRPTDASADLFWATATPPALLTWASLEAASLLAVLVYAFTGSPSAVGVAALAILLLVVVLNPARLERR